MVIALLAFPTAAQAQHGPRARLGEQPLSQEQRLPLVARSSRTAPGSAVTRPRRISAKIPPVSAAPGSALPLRFDQPVSNISSGQGALTQVDATTWTFALPASAVGSQSGRPSAPTSPGPDVTGSAMFFAHVAVTSQSVSDSAAHALRRAGAGEGSGAGHGSRLRRRSRQAPLRRRQAHVLRPGERRLRLDVRRGSGTAWLVTQYTFPGAKPVEVSQRLNP